MCGLDIPIETVCPNIDCPIDAERKHLYIRTYVVVVPRLGCIEHVDEGYPIARFDVCMSYS